MQILGVDFEDATKLPSSNSMLDVKPKTNMIVLQLEIEFSITLTTLRSFKPLFSHHVNAYLSSSFTIYVFALNKFENLKQFENFKLLRTCRHSRRKALTQMENPALIQAICDCITNTLFKNILFGWNKKGTLTKNKNVLGKSYSTSIKKKL